MNFDNFGQIWNESLGRFTKSGRDAIHETKIEEWVDRGIDLAFDPSFWEGMVREAVERLQEEIAGTDNLR
jgi:hypothetical protein